MIPFSPLLMTWVMETSPEAMNSRLLSLRGALSDVGKWRTQGRGSTYNISTKLYHKPMLTAQRHSGIPYFFIFLSYESWLFHEFPKALGTTYLPIHLKGLCPETTGPGTVHGYCFSVVRGDHQMPVGLSGVSASVGKHPSVFSLSKYHKISNIKHLLVDFCCGSPLCWKDPYYVYHDASWYLARPLRQWFLWFPTARGSGIYCFDCLVRRSESQLQEVSTVVVSQQDCRLAWMICIFCCLGNHHISNFPTNSRPFPENSLLDVLDTSGWIQHRQGGWDSRGDMFENHFASSLNPIALRLEDCQSLHVVRLFREACTRYKEGYVKEREAECQTDSKILQAVWPRFSISRNWVHEVAGNNRCISASIVTSTTLWKWSKSMYFQISRHIESWMLK